MIETEFENRTEAQTVPLSDLQITEIGAQHFDESLVPADGISFYIMRLFKAIVVRANREFYIGRVEQEDLWKPSVNLSELDGFAMGVSRRHAMILPVRHGYQVIDLRSTNGSWLNERRLIPHKPYSLAPGVKLRLGQETLQVVYRIAP